MLTGVYHLSRRGAQQLLRELVGVTISLGAISTLESRASEGLVSATEEAKREVEGAPVKHADATSWLLAGITMSLWTIASQAATVYKIFSDGCRDTIRPWFGEVIGILVSDRATVFDFWAMALRQICHAHLIRRFVLFSQRDGPAGTIGRELLDLSALVFHYWHGFKAGKLTRALLQQRMRPGAGAVRGSATARRRGRYSAAVGLVRRHPRAQRGAVEFRHPRRCRAYKQSR
jgi:transposase